MALYYLYGRVRYLFLGEKKTQIKLEQINNDIEYLQLYGDNGSYLRFQSEKDGSCLEFRKRLKKREPNRFQMILYLDVYRQEIFNNSVSAFKREGIPYKILKSEGKMPKRVVVECGRNLELTKVCAGIVMTEGFGLKPDNYCWRQTKGPYSWAAVGFGDSLEVVPYGLFVSLSKLESIIEALRDSPDEQACVYFGNANTPLPALKREYNNGKITFSLEYPVVDSPSRIMIRKLREEGVEFHKIDRISEGPVYRIPLGSSPSEVAEKLKPILWDGLRLIKYRNDEKPLKYRLSEFVTADWKPKDEADNDATHGK